MAKKRNIGSESIVSTGAAAARTQRVTTRTKHSATAPEVEAETPNMTTAEPTPTTAEATAIGPSYEEIASLAYSYWEARGCQGGSAEEDWLRAEQELRAARTSS